MSEVKSTYNVIAKILNNFTGHGGWGGQRPFINFIKKQEK